MLSSSSSGSIRGKDRPILHPGMRRPPLVCISNALPSTPPSNGLLDEFHAATKETRNLELVIKMLHGLIKDETKAFNKASAIVEKSYDVTVVRGNEHSEADALEVSLLASRSTSYVAQFIRLP